MVKFFNERTAIQKAEWVAQGEQFSILLPLKHVQKLNEAGGFPLGYQICPSRAIRGQRGTLPV